MARKTSTTTTNADRICVPPPKLTAAQEVRAARRAVKINPVNQPRQAGEVLAPQRLALLTSKYWGSGGVRLTVGFLQPTSEALRNRILGHLNAWSTFCNVAFTWTPTNPQVRISFGKGGYWSYLGTDLLGIPKGQPTMNLEGFSLQTPETEFVRVVRHEAGHTLGFVHEHLRRELVNKIDVTKAIEYFGRTQGWSAQETRNQVLTPLEESSLLGTDHADQDSILCYQLPGSITKDGKPIRGGSDIDDEDKAFAAKVYPLPNQPPPPPQPPAGATLVVPVAGTYRLISA